MDENLLKRTGHYILVMMGLFNVLILNWIAMQGFDPWINIFIIGGWNATIIYIEELLRLYFKIPKEDSGNVEDVGETPVTPQPQDTQPVG